MQENPVTETDFATEEGHGRREERPCLNTQVDPTEGLQCVSTGRRMLVSRTPRTDGWEEMGTTSFPPSLHLHWAVCPVQPRKDKQKMLNKSITHV